MENIAKERITPKKILSVDYRAYSDVEFPKMVTLLFRNEINLGEFKEKYESSVQNVQTRDNGIDFILKKDGNISGIGQCKLLTKSSTILFKDFLNEILKFILYAKYDGLFENFEKVTYYFIAPYGISKKIILFSSNRYSRTVENLESELNSVFKKNKTLNTLFPPNQRNNLAIEVEEIYKKINIELMDSERLDGLLNKDYNQNLIINSPEFSSFSSKPIETILSDFALASREILQISNNIHKIPDYTIPRIEVEKLYKLIRARKVNQKLSNRILLIGSPGIGKSSILKSLFIKLNNENIPVLGIKIDKYPNIQSIKDLEEQLNINGEIVKQLNTLTGSYENVVVILDQLDSINLFQTHKQNSWIAYKNIFFLLSKIPNLTTIISIRNYDLETDPDFKAMEKEPNHKITVSHLEKSHVESTLFQLNINYSKLPIILQDLLAIPNNLNIFCNLDFSLLNTHSLITLNSLYKELWKQKITNCPEIFLVAKNTCREFMDIICKKMLEVGRLTVSKIRYEDNYRKEIDYLTSCGLLTQDANDLGFFHSKFYEFVLAHRFIDNNESIQEYLSVKHQGLDVRTLIRTVLELQRETDIYDYLCSLRYLLTNESIAIHLKFLTINVLANQETVIKEEIEILEKVIFPKDHLKTHFYEVVKGKDWITYLLSRNIINSLISEKKERVSIFILRRNLPREKEIILPFLKDKLLDFDGKSNFIHEVLFYLKEWDSEISKQLFEQCTPENDYQKRWSFNMLQEACYYDPLWVIEKFEKYLSTIESDKLSSRLPHSATELLETLFELDPINTNQMILNFITNTIQNNSHIEDETTSILIDTFSPIFDDNTQDEEKLIGKYQQFLLKEAERNSNIFRNFARKNLSSNYSTIIKLLLNGISINPSKNAPEFYDFFFLYNSKGGFGFNHWIDHKIRWILKEVYEELEVHQKNQINTFIFCIDENIQPKMYFHDKEKKEIVGFNVADKYEFILCIPESEIIKNPELKKKKLELERKFGTKTLTSPRKSSFARGIPSPIPSIFFEKTSFKNLKKSFLKYNKNYESKSRDSKGSISELSSLFKEMVSSNPSRYFPMIEKLIHEFKVDQIYIVCGLEGLVKGNFDPFETLRLFKEAMWKISDKQSLKQFIYISDYFIDKGIADKSVINFYQFQLNTNFDEIDNTKEFSSPDLYLGGLNSIRGAIALRIPYFYRLAEAKAQIFQITEKLSKDKEISVQTMLLQHLYLLEFLDPTLTKSIFLDIFKVENKNLLIASFKTTNNLAFTDFPAVKHILLKLLDIEKTSNGAVQILFYCWLNDVEESYPILKETLIKYPGAKAALAEILLKSLIYKEEKAIRGKTYNLILEVLKEKDIEIIENFNQGFYKLDEENFELLLPFLKEYTKSELAKVHQGGFYIFLSKCCAKYPEECLNLISNLKEFTDIAKDELERFEDEIIEIILTCYRNLHSEDIINKKLAITLFDQALLNDNLRMEAFRKIDKLEVE